MVHLHARSWFSFQAGCSSPLLLARAAARLEQNALAVTDCNTLAGAVRHARACEAFGLRPIFGATLSIAPEPQAPDPTARRQRSVAASALVRNSLARTSLARTSLVRHPLVLLCADREGYANLCDLITRAHQRALESGDRADPHLYLTDLEERTTGLFCLSADREGALATHILRADWEDARQLACRLAALFPQRFFVELVEHSRVHETGLVRHLVQLAQTLNLPMVASNAVRYAAAPDYHLFDALVCSRLGLTVAQGHPLRPVNCLAYLCSEKSLLKRGLPAAALATSRSLATECAVGLLPGEVTPPHSHLPPGQAAAAYLRELCFQGLLTRRLVDKQRARVQLEKELQVVCSLELEEFFLVVREVMAFARGRGIRCCGRGSAANSIIAYLLGITEVDPIQHNLLFERFLHAGRRGMPDVDVDFETHRRHEVIEWMSKRWGDEHTAMTANSVTYRLRSAVRDFGKVLGYPLPLLDRANKNVPHLGVRRALEVRADLADVLGEGLALDVMLGLCSALHDGQESCPRHLSLHSGGMILSREPLRYLSPIQTSANGVRQAQFNKDDVESLGLIKFDVLGLRMLSVITEAGHLLESVGAVAPDVEDLPPQDERTFDMIRAGQTLGVFQIESPGQWNLLARSQPENFGDLVAQVALFRPGPLQGNMVNPYVSRRRGWTQTFYPHPSLEPALRDTYGLILYQEQVLEVAHAFAGMSLSDADEFRRLMSKFRDPGEMEAMRGRFVDGAVSTHAETEYPVLPALAHAVFDLVSKFVGYGFCRSHAAAFARTVYQSAYLKAHHPAAYIAGVLEHKPGFYPLHTILEEARMSGVRVLPACIHRSGVKYSLERPDRSADLAIRVPLTQVDQISQERAAFIVLERMLAPFQSLDELHRRVPLSLDCWSNLARAGALDTFGTRREVLWHLGRLQASRDKEAKRGLQLTLDDAIQTSLDLDIPRDALLLADLNTAERAIWDFNTQRLTTGPHPVALRRPDLERLGALSIAQLFEHPVDTRVRVGGAVISRQRPPTAKGFCFLIMEDETGRLPTAMSPNMYEKFRRVLREPGLLLEGRLEGPPQAKDQKYSTGRYRSILIDRVWSLEAVCDNAVQAPRVGTFGNPGENPRTAQVIG